MSPTASSTPGSPAQDWIAEHEVGHPERARSSSRSPISSTRSRASARCAGCWPCRKTRRFQSRRISTARRSPPSWCASRRRTSSGRACTVNVEFSWGATEVKPPVLADAIVEATETGSTLRANRLRIIDTVLESNTQLIANQTALADAWKRTKIENMALLLQGGDRGAGPRRADAERDADRPRRSSRCCRRCSGRRFRRSATTTGSR